MTDELLLPHRITLLGQALRPCLLNLQNRIDAPVALDTSAPPVADLIVSHMSRVNIAVRNLTSGIDLLMNEVIANETASDNDVYRAAGRFEAIPDEFINAYRDVQRVIAWRVEAEARDLLAGMYRHFLLEICNWLEKLVDTLHDPVAELHRRGLPTEGTVVLPIELQLTPAPQIGQLAAWIKSQSGLSGAVSRLGFWPAVCAAVIGWKIGSL